MNPSIIDAHARFLLRDLQKKGTPYKDWEELSEGARNALRIKARQYMNVINVRG